MLHSSQDRIITVVADYLAPLSYKIHMALQQAEYVERSGVGNLLISFFLGSPFLKVMNNTLWILSGVWKDKEELVELRKTTSILPSYDSFEYDVTKKFNQWERAVGRLLDWYS